MTDIKVNLTTNAIYHALFRLLETKNFDEISVNDICQESLISRTTFYSYFEDKYVLVLFCLSQERTLLGLKKGHDVRNNLTRFLKRIKSKKTIYKNLLVTHINQELRIMIASQFNDTIDFILDDTYEGDERDIVTELYTGGLSFVLMKWINDDCRIDEALIAQAIWNELPTTKKNKPH